VGFGKAIGNVIGKLRRLGKEFTESIPQNRCGRDAVGVEVAPDGDFFLGVAGGLESIDSQCHFVAKFGGTVGLVLASVDETGELDEIPNAALPEDLGNVVAFERLAQGLHRCAEGIAGLGVGENPGLLHGGRWVEAGRSASCYSTCRPDRTVITGGGQGQEAKPCVRLRAT
jgi:hypothetical protein